MQNLTFGGDGGLTSACQAKHPAEPWLCFMSPHMQDVIQTPFFMFVSAMWPCDRRHQCCCSHGSRGLPGSATTDTAAAARETVASPPLRQFAELFPN